MPGCTKTFDGPEWLDLPSAIHSRSKRMPRFSPERRNFTLAAAAAATAVVLNPADTLAGLSHAGSSNEQQTKAVVAPSLDQRAPSAMEKLSPTAKAEVEM